MIRINDVDNSKGGDVDYFIRQLDNNNYEFLVRGGSTEDEALELLRENEGGGNMSRRIGQSGTLANNSLTFLSYIVDRVAANMVSEKSKRSLTLGIRSLTLGIRSISH